MCYREKQDLSSVLGKAVVNPGQSRCTFLCSVGRVVLQQNYMTPNIKKTNVITGESEEFKPVSSEDINLSSQTTTLDNAIHSLLV